MLRVLERVARASAGSIGRGSISKRLRSNGAETFRGVSSVALNVAEYFLEATERVMDYLNCTSEKKLKGLVSLLCDEAYQWWLTVKEGMPADRLIWDFFKVAFLGKYVDASDFEDDLRDELHVLIASQREWDFAGLVKKAKIAKEVKRSERQNREKDKDCSLAPIVGELTKVTVGNELGHALNVGLRIIKLRIVLRGLLRCRETPGRGAGNNKVRQPALVYAARRREDGDAPDVITGQLVGMSKLFRDVPLEVQGVVFSADLMELPFGEFDIILGMDWLVKHRVKLDYAVRRMVLKAKKLVRKGCEAFLAYVNIFDSKGSSMGDVRTVKEFLDVFPEELPGLPPDREVEFDIELLPGTAPVSIAPYRMASKELVELKAQI
ncbi:uncharacterized protein [Gossypium hirsutum]|uniref:Uncharacterized protein n=1 Tax=Gossypium hirsutum TaxID=3635 RepID=A0A1U8IB68_GOSHI|nr:uncharacterized protein LOC107894605 [Gossypium hirsutum]